MHRGKRSTPPGQHRPVLLDEVLRALAPRPGEIAVDCTLGWAGHAVELLQRVGPDGRVIGMDMDADNLPEARRRLEEVGSPFALHHGNFAGIQSILAAEGFQQVDVVLADLGMSSMQVDDPQRGFSYSRPGPLDMRMDRSRGQTAAELLATIAPAALAEHLRDLGDEPEADKIATAIAEARRNKPIATTAELSHLIVDALHPQRQPGKWRLHPAKDQWKTHPAARTFQVLRILVNRELANLQQLLRILPLILRPGGRAAIISFHSGEDRLVKTAFREGLRQGLYAAASDDPVRASAGERIANPRSRSAKLRWATAV